MTNNETQEVTTNQSRIVTIADAARELGKSERTIRRYIHEGKLNQVDINGSTCVQLSVIDNTPTMTAVGVNPTANDHRNNDELHRQIEDGLREQVKMLRAENERLWDTLKSMLPAPRQQTEITDVESIDARSQVSQQQAEVSDKKPVNRAWIINGVLFIALVVGWLAYYLGWLW